MTAILNRMPLGYHRVTVQVEMKTGIESLREILYQFEMKKPLMLLDNVRIKKHKIRSKDRHKNKNLSVRLNITAFSHIAGR